MNFFDTEIYLPVDRYEFAVTTETPRSPTAFEWAVVKIVHDFGANPAYAAATVADVFRTALGCEGAEGFLESALNELFSATTNALTTDDHTVLPIHLPISSIRLTEDGLRLVQTGYLPSAPRQSLRKVVYDPLARQLFTDEFEEKIPSPGAPIVNVQAVDAGPVTELLRTREEAKVKDGTRVGRIESVGECRRTWRRQRVGFTLEDGRVAIDRKAFDLSSEVADYLSALTHDRARQLFFDPVFGNAEAWPSEVTESPKGDGVLQIRPPAHGDVSTAVPSSLVARGTSGDELRFIATALEVTPGDQLRVQWDENGIARMSVPHGIVPYGAVSDGKTINTRQRIRCFYGDLPLELPVSVETVMDDASGQTFAEDVARAIGQLPLSDQCRLQFQLAENHVQRVQIVAHAVAQTTGDARVAVLKALLDGLHARTAGMDLHAVIDGVFGQPGLAGFADVAEAQSLAEALPLTEDEKHWVKNALRKYENGRATVGEEPENELVWTEESSKNRSSHGRHGHNKHRHQNRR